MRLQNRLKNHIKSSVLSSFGEVDIYLFGSRADDTKQGGDIDLAIDVELSPAEFNKKKIKFITYLIRKNLDLKIDIVPYNSQDPLLCSEIHKHGIKLN